MRIASSAVCEPAVFGNNQRFSQFRDLRKLILSWLIVVGKRRIATVTISHSLVLILSIASSLVLYLPVPNIKREENDLPPIFKGSNIFFIIFHNFILNSPGRI